MATARPIRFWRGGFEDHRTPAQAGVQSLRRSLDPGLRRGTMIHHYALALGSNRRHGRHGAPEQVIAAALSALAENGLTIKAASSIRATPALGPGGRRYANAAAIVSSALAPPALLALLKRIERSFGRRRGRRWGARVLDIDIILWSGGLWAGRGLGVPHPEFRRRRFVLDPLAAIAGDCRDPLSGLTVRHLRTRLTRARPINRTPPRSGS